jgi:hypothetical protein
MKNTKVLLAVILLAMVVIAVVMLLHNEQQKRTKVRPPKPPPVKVAQVAKPVRVVPKSESVRPRAPRDAARPEKHAKKGAKKDPAAGAVTFLVLPAEPADKNVPAHVAREALKLVGTDPVAETIWIDAINNPALPAADRKNLIEDLNEAGFADPKNPAETELPLIQHRIALIEKLAPTPMDDVNAAAFAEAYKDLKAMAARLTQPPQPQPPPEQPAMQPQPEQPQPQPDQPQPQPPQQ